MRRWLRHRLIIPVVRSPHSAEYTARGVANGLFWGLTPTVGVQTLAIVATWLLARRVFGRPSSLVQAFLWTWVTNPLTMVPLYYVFYVTGLWVLGEVGPARGYAAFGEIWTRPDAAWMGRIASLAGAVGIATLVGSLPYAVAGSVLGYRWALTVCGERRRRLRRRLATEGARVGGRQVSGVEQTADL